MPYRDRFNNVCGFLDLEAEDHHGHYSRHFFQLDVRSNILDFFADNPVNLPPDTGPVGSFNIRYLSLVNDAKSLKPKVPYCFCLTFAGKMYFLKANDLEDKEMWMDILKDAAKVTVCSKQQSLSTDSVDSGVMECSYRASNHSIARMSNESMGGAALCCSDSETESNTEETVLPWQQTMHQSPLMMGYCVKQGFVRKNWKRRYFVMSLDGISYFKSHQSKSPIKTVALADVLEARLSMGIHPTKENVLEIVTPQRVYYIQPETVREREGWINCINKTVLALRRPKLHEQGSQTDLAGKLANSCSLVTNVATATEDLEDVEDPLAVVSVRL